MAQKQRKQRRRRQIKKRGPTNKTLDKKIKHIENNLIELKWLDVARAFTATSIAGIQDYLSAVPQGDTSISRTGNVLSPTSIQLRLTFASNILELGGDGRIRYILFWDRQANGAVPVLTGASTTQSLLDTGVIADPTLSPRNFNTIERYTILLDKMVTLQPVLAGSTTLAGAVDTLTTTNLVTRTKVHVVKLGRMIKYNDAAAGIATAVSNALHIAYFTDAAANQAGVQAGYRLYFKDA